MFGSEPHSSEPGPNPTGGGNKSGLDGNGIRSGTAPVAAGLENFAAQNQGFKLSGLWFPYPLYMTYRSHDVIKKHAEPVKKRVFGGVRGSR